MRGVNLILAGSQLDLASWVNILSSRFEQVEGEFDAELAQREGLVAGSLNRVYICDGDHRITAAVRPTTEREYDEDELAEIERVLPGGRTYVALSYTDSLLLESVVAALHDWAQNASRSLLIDTDDGAFTLLDSPEK